MKKVIMLINIFIIASAILAGCIIGKEINTSTSTVSKISEIKWKEGFTETEYGTYIPDSFDSLYKRVKNHKMYQEWETECNRKIIFNEEEVKELIATKNKVAPQAYPPQAMLSPIQTNIGEYYPYANGILFIPNTTLNKTVNSNLGLSKIQYKAILNDLDMCKEEFSKPIYSKPYEVEVMEMDCKLSQIPSQIQIITKLPMIVEQYLPRLIITQNDSVEVIYNTSVSVSNNMNSACLYIMSKKGGCISSSGMYNKNGKLDKDNNIMPIEEVEKIIYLFFISDITFKKVNREIEERFYRPKIVVFNIVE